MAQDLKEYTEEQARTHLAEMGLDRWFVENGWIRRKYNTDGWPTTLQVVNAVGFLCEAGYHHADLEVTWGRVLVKLKTHSHRAITDMDFEMEPAAAPTRKNHRATSWPAPISAKVPYLIASRLIRSAFSCVLSVTASSATRSRFHTLLLSAITRRSYTLFRPRAA